MNDVTGSVYSKLRDPPSFLHFHFAVFVDDHGACSVKHVAAAEKWVGVWSVSSVCAWCMKGKKGVWKTSNHPFNFLFIFVCVYAFCMSLM